MMTAATGLRDLTKQQKELQKKLHEIQQQIQKATRNLQHEQRCYDIWQLVHIQVQLANSTSGGQNRARDQLQSNRAATTKGEPGLGTARRKSPTTEAGSYEVLVGRLQEWTACAAESLHRRCLERIREALEQDLLVIQLEVKQEAHFLEQLEKLLHQDMGSMAKGLDSEYAQFCYNELCAIAQRRAVCCEACSSINMILSVSEPCSLLATNAESTFFDWHTAGSEYIGHDVLRAVTYNDGRVGEGWGSITGWLSADESDFINDQSEAAALWHVVFDDTALGEEDLEEHAVKEAVLAARSKKQETAVIRLQKTSAKEAWDEGRNESRSKADNLNNAAPSIACSSKTARIALRLLADKIMTIIDKTEAVGEQTALAKLLWQTQQLHQQKISHRPMTTLVMYSEAHSRCVKGAVGESCNGGNNCHHGEAVFVSGEVDSASAACVEYLQGVKAVLDRWAPHFSIVLSS